MTPAQRHADTRKRIADRIERERRAVIERQYRAARATAPMELRDAA